ncbi:glycoside hydrolase family 19 protein [Beijerinckia sp. L45]|uniref:glycoside hydrolase family 19 protein n=1 Tax=Beijerinckia sp. L45 TaxID=1641855 RepID=UPI001FEF9C74|nr:glycoside hydrolase family 19 protein [Beijerinckia sp. L45]
MIDRPFFFSAIRPKLFSSLTQDQVDGFDQLIDVWEQSYSTSPIAYLAYCLATATWETGRTIQPIEEVGKGRGTAYGPTGFWGRGYVQLTWEANYKKAGTELGVDLVDNPTLALDPIIAAKIMYRGMLDGWFTSKKLSDYIPHDPVEARRIINGTDHAQTIAGYYDVYLSALKVVTAQSPTTSSAPVTTSWLSRITSVFRKT